MTEREKILRARNLIQAFFNGNDQKRVAWFNAPNLSLSGLSPNEMIARGRIDKLLLYIEGALHENKTHN